MSLIAPRNRPSVRAVRPAWPRIRRVRVRWWAWVAGLALLAAGLDIAYLHLSQAYPENSDEANILLMAADMAHGNLLLHGWNVSDVSFITTELPQIALLVVLFGLRMGTAHIAAAMTYTLVVLTAMALARGRAGGRAGAARMLLALAIMLSPQPGVGVFVLILSVGHVGTAVPVMLTWLALERYGRGLPGAVLAARTLGDRLAEGRLLSGPRRPPSVAAARHAAYRAGPRWTAGRVALAVLAAVTLGGYCLGLVVHATARPAADPYGGVERYLESHHLTRGLSGYWQASYITVDTGGAVTVRAVIGACLQPYLWEARAQWYRPDRWHPATFLLTSSVSGYFRSYAPTDGTLRVLSEWYPRARLVAFGGTHPVAGTTAPDYLLHAYPADLMAQFPRLRAALQTPTAPCS